MINEMHPEAVSQVSPMSCETTASGDEVRKFRFIPESYLSAIGTVWDAGLDEINLSSDVC